MRTLSLLGMHLFRLAAEFRDRLWHPHVVIVIFGIRPAVVRHNGAAGYWA